MKKPTSFRLSDEALGLLKKLSERQHRSQAATLEVIIKDRAKQEGVGPHEREGSERPEG